MSEFAKDKTAVKVEHLDATTPENAAKQAGFGFASHGLMIKDKNQEIVFKQADHNVNEEDVKAFVTKYLKKHH